jgi:hypothetical protein
MMTKRTNRVAWGLAAVLALVVLGEVGFWVSEGKEERLPPVAEVKRSIASALAHGADVGTGLQFLQENGIKHTEYFAEAGQVNASMTQPPRGWFQFGGGIYMVFRFNSERKLLDYEVERQWIAW